MPFINSIYTFANLNPFSNICYNLVTTKSLPSFRNKNGGLAYQNIKKTCSILNIAYERLILMQQVHSANIASVKDLKKRKLIATDGMIITEKGIYGCILTADCLPIIFFDPVKKHLALIHAGYKGLLNNIIASLIERLKNAGSKPYDIFVAIGPAIGKCCYSVSKSRALQFAAVLPQARQSYLTKKDGKLYLDLKKIAKLQLQNNGIDLHKLEIAPFCTKTDNNLFYSYRAEGDNFGEFATIAALL